MSQLPLKNLEIPLTKAMRLGKKLPIILEPLEKNIRLKGKLALVRIEHL